MTFDDLQPVVLDVDVPEHGLPKRSLGAVVEGNGKGAYEVEFVSASGRTVALVTLKASQLRKPTDDDLLCVSQIAQARSDSLKPRSRPR
jgi:uncharacterized protein DUF4926